MKNKKTATKKEKKTELPLYIKTNYPSPTVDLENKLTAQEKIDFIKIRYKEIMEALGLDLTDDSLQKTPERIAKMYVNEIFSGLDSSTFPEISFFENKLRSKNSATDLVCVKVNFTSFCEHHFVPMTGYAYIAYIPNKKLIGLSKIPRIVKFFAKRPQLQERLAAQIVDSLSLLLETDNVAISMVAEHYCVIARGIENEHSNTITNILRGKFQSNELLKKEFFESIKRQDIL